MSKTSYLGYYERQDLDHLDNDCSVDTLRSWLAAQNTQHLIDSASQHRMNAVREAPSPFSCFTLTGIYSPTIYSQKVAWTWFADRPAGCAIKLTASTNDTNDPLFVRVRFVPAHTPLGDLTVPSFFDLTSDTTGGTTLSIDTYFAAADFDIDAVAFAEASLLHNYYRVAVDEGGDLFEVVLPRMRLEVLMTQTSNVSETVHRLTQIFLRESA